MQQVFVLVQIAIPADDVEGCVGYQAGLAGQASKRFQMGVNELRQRSSGAAAIFSRSSRWRAPVPICDRRLADTTRSR